LLGVLGFPLIGFVKCLIIHANHGLDFKFLPRRGITFVEKNIEYPPFSLRRSVTFLKVTLLRSENGKIPYHFLQRLCLSEAENILKLKIQLVIRIIYKTVLHFSIPQNQIAFFPVIFV
jgi:hypothetical protein